MGPSIWSMPRAAAKTGSTRERLLDAAAALFYERGFHAVGLDQILADVGVTKTTFYNHFESKDALIVAVLDHRDAHDIEALRARLAGHGGAPRERLLAVFDVLDEWFRDPDFKGCFFINAAAQFPHAHDPVHVAAARHAHNIHAEMLALARAAGAPDPDALARQLDMLIGAAITARHVAGDPGAAQAARAMAEMLLAR